MDVESLEAEGKATAAKHVANMLQRPDQLEKVEQYKKRVLRKKAAVEAMLKTAMQSKLDGVRSGLNQFQLALQGLKEIKENIQDIEESLGEIMNLKEKLKDVKSENIKHSQYAAAMENLKNIFTVPENVEKTQTWIAEGKLLLSHQSLSDLESSRDDLLFELHKLPNQNPSDITMLRHYFADVDKLSNMLSKQLWLVLKRTLNSVRKEPTIIVTALRIIEREERADQFALQRQKQTNFLPPGRPKNWKLKAFEVLKEAVHERIEGNQFEERKDAKMWLVRHLEVTRQLTLEDLRVVKTLCTPCFPPHYDIFNRFVKMYHDCLARHLQDVIASGLEGNEYVSLLNWLNTYKGLELFGHPDLGIDSNTIKPLLNEEVVNSLIRKYLGFLKQNFEEWMKNTLESDIKDWYRETQPDADGEGYFHTVVPVIVFQMVDQNLQVAKTVDEHMVSKVLLLCMDQVMNFAGMYKDAIIEFKDKYFEDRSKVKYFTHYMIAVVNNCLQFRELSQLLKKRFWKPGVHDKEIEETIEKMITTFEGLNIDCAGFLLDEVFLDLEPHSQDLLTKKWLESSVPIDTICCTIEDYCNDYRHLRTKNFELIMNEAQNKVCNLYITAILQRKMSFRNYDERRTAAEKIIKESEQIKKVFNRLTAEHAMLETSCDIIVSLAEVLKVQDTEFLSLELSGMVRKYPDMTQDHLTSLLSFRGDMGRADVKQLVSEIIPERRDVQKSSLPKSLFSGIQISLGF